MKPVPVPYVPAAHMAHTEVPVEFWYPPVIHGEHTVIPALSVMDPARQTVQLATDEAPRPLEYLPASHSVHVAFDTALRAPDHVPGVHKPQEVTLAYAVPVPYLPDPQDVHALAPDVEE